RAVEAAGDEVVEQREADRVGPARGADDGNRARREDGVERAAPGGRVRLAGRRVVAPGRQGRGHVVTQQWFAHRSHPPGGTVPHRGQGSQNGASTRTPCGASRIRTGSSSRQRSPSTWAKVPAGPWRTTSSTWATATSARRR